MHLKELRVGMKVTDRWYPDWGSGKVVKLLKTRVKLKFVSAPDYECDREGLMVYDNSHVQFLERVTK